MDRYLDIMRMRFGDRLAVSSHVDIGALDALVPSLILQPLVENAIKHGVERLLGQGRVEIEGRRVGDTLVLRVRDDGPAEEEHRPDPARRRRQARQRAHLLRDRLARRGAARVVVGHGAR